MKEEKVIWCARLVWSSINEDCTHHKIQEHVWTRNPYQPANDAWLAAGYTGSGEASPLFEADSQSDVIKLMNFFKQEVVKWHSI